MANEAGTSGGSTKGTSKKWKKEPKTPTVNVTGGAAAGAGASTSKPASPSYTTPSETRAPTYSSQPTTKSYSSQSYFKPQTRTAPPSLFDITQQFKKQLDNRPTPEPKFESSFGDVLADAQDTLHEVATNDPKIYGGGLFPNTSEQGLAKAKRDNKAFDNLFAPDAKLNKAQQTQLRHLNDMPEGEEIDLPERFQYEGNKKGNALKWWWDKSYIDGILGDYAAAGDDFNYDLMVSRIIDSRYKDKEKFGYVRSRQRSEQIQNVLQEATQALYNRDEDNRLDPDFEYLQRAMEEDPKLSLDPLRYREDYGIEGDDFREQMNRELEGVSDPVKRAEIREKYLGYDAPTDTYDKIEKSYRKASRYAKDAIAKYEAAYNQMVEDHGDENTGPAIPDTSSKAETDPIVDDAVDDKFAFLYAGRQGANKLRQKQRAKVQEELGLENLPSVQTMLKMAVMNGMVDPSDESAVNETIDRLRNPSHPDTRALYAFVAQARNPEITDEQALEFINRPYQKFIEAWDENSAEFAKNQAIDKRIENAEDWSDITGVGDFFSDVGNTFMKGEFSTQGLNLAPEGLSDEEKRFWYSQNKGAAFEGIESKGAFHDYINEGENNLQGKGLMWTLDKIMRLGYGVAGFSQGLTGADEDHGEDRSWGSKWLENAYQFVMPSDILFEAFTGKSQTETWDEILEDPLSVGRQVYEPTKNQVLRGTRFSDEDTTPLLFSQVMAKNARTDNQETLHDKRGYQLGMGFVADVMMDPLTYVGVGTVSNISKFSLKASGAVADAAVVGRSMAREQISRRLLGDSISADMEKFNRLNSVTIPKHNWVSRLARRDSSREANISFQVRQMLRPGRPTTELPDAPFARLEDLPSIDESPTVANITAILDDLNVQREAMNTDLTVDAMIKEYEGFLNASDEFTFTPGMGDIRSERLVGNQTKGLIHAIEEEADALGSAQGMGRRGYNKDGTGAAARNAQAEIDQLMQRTSVRRTGAEAGVQIPPAMQKRIDELQKIVEEGSYFRKGGMEYLQSGGKLSDSTVKAAHKMLSDATGISRDRINLTDNEILEGLVYGPKMQRASDPDVAEAVANLRKDKANALKALEAAETADQAKNAQMVLNMANQRLDTYNAAGAIHYWMRREQMGPLTRAEDGTTFRSAENGVYRDPELGEHLEYLSKGIAKERMAVPTVAEDTEAALKSDPVTLEDAKKVLSDKEGSPAREISEEEIDWDSFDFANHGVGDIMAMGLSDHSLDVIERVLKRQLKDLSLVEKGQLTGLPPMKAVKLKANVPPHFKTDGKLDPEKVLKSGKVKLELKYPDTDYARWEVAYSKGDTPEETAFLRNFAKAVEDNYVSQYRKMNLHYKSDVTGIGVTTKAKHKFEPGPHAPRHVVAIGTKGKDAMFRAATKNKAIKSVVRDTDHKFGVNGSSARDIKLIHEAIKKSDADGVPPVVYLFDVADEHISRTIDYAQQRGVVVRRIRGTGKALSADTMPEIAGKFDMKAPLRPDEGYEGTSWWRNWARRTGDESLNSGKQLMDAALESGKFKDFYEALFLPGAPFNIDRALTQVDDVFKKHLDEADEVARTIDDVVPEKAVARAELDDSVTPAEQIARDKNKKTRKKLDETGTYAEPPKRIQYGGVVYDSNISKARAALSKKYGKNKANEIIEAHAKEWFNYLNALDGNAVVKYFNDLFGGAKRAAQHSWNKRAGEKLRARENARYADRTILPPGSLGDKYKTLSHDAFTAAVRETTDQINTRGTISAGPNSMRNRTAVNMTDEEISESAGTTYKKQWDKRKRKGIDETTRDMVRVVKQNHNYKIAKERAKLSQTRNPGERAEINERIKFWEKQKKIEVAEAGKLRQQAIDARKQLRKDDIADGIIQVSMYPGKNLSGKQAAELVAGVKMDLEGAVNKLVQPEVAAKMAAHRWFQIRAQNFQHLIDEKFTRPSRQVGTTEGREIIALMTGTAPVLIKRDLERINTRMSGMLAENRKQAFTSYREGVQYGGPQPEKFQGVTDELNELEDIFNGTHPEFHFMKEVSADAKAFVTLQDLAHWLPEGFMPDLKKLNNLRKRNPGGRIKMKDVWESIPRKGEGAWDPAVFAHTTRIAANQAREARVAMDALNRTFGVPRTITFDKTHPVYGQRIKQVPSDTSTHVERLKDLGWRTLPELGETHYFHPLVVDEVKKVLSLINKKDARTEFGKMADSVISQWKGLQTTYSPAYYTRNLIGEGLMAWLGGVKNPAYFKKAAHGIAWISGKDRDLADLVRQIPDLSDSIPVDVANGKAIAARLRDKAGNGTDLTYEDVWRLYTQRGLKSTFVNTEIRQHGARSGTAGLLSDRAVSRRFKQGLNKLHNFGEGAEDYVRFAHFLHALEHSGRATMESAATYAAQRVRKYHFDYTDVSDFEKMVLGRTYPFYKWTRFAAPVMLSHLFLAPGKMTMPFKGINALANTLSSRDVFEDTNGHLPSYSGMAPAWVRDLFSYEVSGAEGADDEYADYIRIATPQADALMAVTNPSMAGIGMLNPGIRAALELGKNSSLDPEFAGMSIRGGDFNESYNINDLEAVGMYAGKMLGPFGNLASKTYRGMQENDYGQTYGEYQQEAGYDKWKDLFNLTGISAYQAKDERPSDDIMARGVFDETAAPAVGAGVMSQDPLLSGRKAASQTAGSNPDILQQLVGDDGGNGWIDYGNGRGWVNYGGGGYGGGGYGAGSGYSFSRSEWNDSLLELILSLKGSIEQSGVEYDSQL